MRHVGRNLKIKKIEKMPILLAEATGWRQSHVVEKILDVGVMNVFSVACFDDQFPNFKDKN
jgi:hypothetical protein